ncbi:MAG: hypothetical protein KL863_03440 [Rhizobium sp.]|nr:hypothetical protein [Rhizobium sp.]
MTNPNTTDEQEAPLDPTLERVRRKMLRLLIISSSAIVLGLMAVVYSIVYRVNRLPANTATPAASEREEIAPAARQSIALPSGFTVESTAIGGNRILLFGRTADGQLHIVVHDLATGKTVTEIELK